MVRVNCMLLLFYGLICSVTYANYNNDYMIKRQKIISEEESMAFGAKIILDSEERRVNDILMKYKQAEIKTGLFIFDAVEISSHLGKSKAILVY